VSEIKFKIGDEELPLPKLTTATFAEASVVYLVTGLDWESFDECTATEVRVAGLIAVALQRAHPDWAPGTIGQMVRNMEMAMPQFVGLEVADQASPPADETSGSPESTGQSDNASESAEPSG